MGQKMLALLGSIFDLFKLIVVAALSIFLLSKYAYSCILYYKIIFPCCFSLLARFGFRFIGVH